MCLSCNCPQAHSYDQGLERPTIPRPTPSPMMQAAVTESTKFPGNLKTDYMRSTPETPWRTLAQLKGVRWERCIGRDLDNCNTMFLGSFHLCFALVSLYLETVLLSSTRILVFSSNHCYVNLFIQLNLTNTYHSLYTKHCVR